MAAWIEVRSQFGDMAVAQIDARHPIASARTEMMQR
jgi:hypothetical protein